MLSLMDYLKWNKLLGGSSVDFYKYIGSQFSNPRGIIGKICCEKDSFIYRKFLQYEI